MSKFFSNSPASIVFLLLLFFCASTELIADDAPKPDEIIAKHLDSIGTKDKRAQIKNTMAVGSVNFEILRSPTFSKGKVSPGKAVFLSESNKFFFGTRYDSVDYPFDEIVYDAKNVSVAYIKPGNRSVLGNFIVGNRYIVSEGLFGGTLSNGWSLFDLQAREAKVKNAGKKKINGRQTYVLNYLIKGNSPLSVKLFFDAENFQHVRTEYEQVFAAPMVSIPSESAGQVQTIHKLTENFSNYKQVQGLTLPHSYEINLLIDGKLTNEFAWRFDFSNILFNQKIDAKSFEAQ